MNDEDIVCYLYHKLTIAVFDTPGWCLLPWLACRNVTTEDALKLTCIA